MCSANFLASARAVTSAWEDAVPSPAHQDPPSSRGVPAGPSPQHRVSEMLLLDAPSSHSGCCKSKAVSVGNLHGSV